MRASRLVLLLTVSAGPAPAQSDAPVVLRRGDLVWEPGFVALPAGAELAVVVGDPLADGEPYTLRLRMPRGYTVPPHRHPESGTVTVIRGRLLVGTGEEVDAAAGDLLGPGDVVVLAPEEDHWWMALTDRVEVQVESIGPYEVTYVDPEDDPR